MINSDLTDFVTRHSFRICSFVHIEKHDLYDAKAINTVETGTGGPSVFFHRSGRIKAGLLDRMTGMSSSNRKAMTRLSDGAISLLYVSLYAI